MGQFFALPSNCTTRLLMQLYSLRKHQRQEVYSSYLSLLYTDAIQARLLLLLLLLSLLLLTEGFCGVYIRKGG